MMMNFLSCDWGTSFFRLCFAENSVLKMSSAENQGIASCFDLYKKSGKEEGERFLFYRNILDENISLLQQQLKISLQKVPIVISGMASSSIGMIHLPYKEIPVKADGSEFLVRRIAPVSGFAHEIILISGLKTDDDVIRGEETQLAGCEHDLNDEELFIFPGTHSKHIRVKEGRVADFRTYMTGEFFELLSAKSILAASVEKGNGLGDKGNKISFEAGVNASGEANLLHASFVVRTNQLFDKLSSIENYYYLSGLLIGTELRELRKNSFKKITLVINDTLKPYYTTACNILGLQEVAELIIQDAGRALLKGQSRIYNELKK